MLEKKVNSNTVIKNWREILTSLGYPIIKSGNSYKTQGVFRGGNSFNIVIYEDKGRYYDFKESKGGTIEELINLTTGAESSEIQSAILRTESEPTKDFREVINTPKTYSEKTLDKFIRDYTYFEKRGISARIQKMYEAGMVYKESFAYRMTFPIRDYKRDGKIIGFAGRYIQDIKADDKLTQKWIIAGPKRFFVYNYKICVPAIQKEKIVVLTESIGDNLSLAECGIYNTLTLFGTDISKSVTSFLLGQNPDKIIIATNNDENKAGQNGAEKIRNKLSNFFGERKLIIKHPVLNDFNEMLMKSGKYSIVDWYKEIC